MHFKSLMSVYLMEPIIYVKSIPDAMLAIRGTISVNLPSTTIVKSLTVLFDGEMEIKSYLSSSMNAISAGGLALYPAMDQTDINRPLLLEAGRTHYGFEMQVPSKLPETVDCSDFKVNYFVTAVMEYESNCFLRGRRGSIVKSSTRQDLRIVRLPSGNLLGDHNASEFIDSRTHTSAWLQYQILVDNKSIALGSVLPITFRITPTQEKVSVESVNVHILERRDVFGKSSHTSHSVHIISPTAANETKIPNTALSKLWEGTIRYSIPAGKSLVHSTLTNSDFDIEHTLLVSMTLSIPGGIGGPTQKLVTMQSKIDLVDEAVGKLGSLEVPTYDSPPPPPSDDFSNIDHADECN
ncbi:hypothetical protein MBANPS3_000594 [Mucor bainieri]